MPLSSTLIQWYQTHKRDLPWRDIVDPYKIWISEIILQQTRVNQGLDYYHRFIERFPDVTSLATASEDEVLKYWQGLGYYSRARNLHKAARQIVSEHDGLFPNTYEEVIQLAGIGEYTAAAICSFAYNLPFAVVDGNVFRVLSRLFGVDTPIDSTAGKKIFKQLAQEILDKTQPGLHNQAIMEFGALQCVPVSPACNECPLADKCIAYSENQVSALPVKRQKIQTKERFFNYLFIKSGNQTWLQKRTQNDIWKNLFEFPLIEDEKLLDKNELTQHDYFKTLFSDIQSDVHIQSVSPPIKHILTHQKIFAQCVLIEINAKSKKWEQFVQIQIDELGDYAVSRLMEILLQNHLG
ncbi:MAG TPA: A/G-specific adenine glycosylase [Paludibacter sp.]|nr:A/G-specific adenine glycosylase [Paludibacter sp.]